MRTKFLYAWAMAFAVCTFVGCSDDDKPLIPPTDLNTTFGTDDKTQLTLNYSDTPLTGKQVKFETTDSRTATITLLDVIPGEAQTVISNVELVENNDEYTFTGNTSTTTRSVAAVEYSGSVKKGALTLNLKVTMANAGAWAKTYGLAELEKGNVMKWVQQGMTFTDVEFQDIAVSAFYMQAQIPTPKLGGDFTTPQTFFPHAAKLQAARDMAPLAFRKMLGCILPQVLQAVTLQKDGNISASYSSDPVIVDAKWALSEDLTADYVKTLTAGRKWQQSPKNLAYWFEKDGKIYVKLNVGTIIAQALADNGQTGDNSGITDMINGLLSGDANTINALLKSLLGAELKESTITTLLDWVNNGVPLSVKTENGHLCLYLDKATLTPIIDELPALIPVLTKLDPMGMGTMLGQMLTAINYSWPYVESYSIGLDLVQ